MWRDLGIVVEVDGFFVIMSRFCKFRGFFVWIEGFSGSRLGRFILVGLL